MDVDLSKNKFALVGLFLLFVVSPITIFIAGYLFIIVMIIGCYFLGVTSYLHKDFPALILITMFMIINFFIIITINA